MVMIRSWLFVPGHRQKMIDKSPGRGSDALIYDLEDAVPPDEMDAARMKVGAALDAAKGGLTDSFGFTAPGMPPWRPTFERWSGRGCGGWCSPRWTARRT